jgi:hypothetical protein
MARGAALLQHESGNAAAMPVEQFGRSQPAGDENCPHDIAAIGIPLYPAIHQAELRHEAIAEILDIDKPLPQVRIGDAAHAVAQLSHDPHNRRLGRKAGVDQRRDPLEPAAIHGDEAIGGENVVGVAISRAADQLVETTLHAFAGGNQAQLLFGWIGGQQLALRQIGVEPHHSSDDDAIRQRETLEPPRQGIAESLAPDFDRTLCRQHLGEQHGDRLQRLHLQIGEFALQAALDSQHADDMAGSPYGERHQRGKCLLARLRAVRESVMLARVGEIERAAHGGDEADDTLADPHPGAAYGPRLQAVGGGEFEEFSRPDHIERANLAGHFDGHEGDELRQGRGALGQALPQPRE